MKQPNNCYKISLGGVIVALCALGFLAANILPSFSFIIAMYLGFLIGVVSYEVNEKWAILTFLAVILLSIFISPDLSPVIVFAMFFGYYPIVFVRFADKKKNIIQLIFKLVIFNSSFWLWYKLMTLIVPTFELLLKNQFINDNLILSLIIGSNIFFWSYNVMLENAYEYYTKKFRKTYLLK